MRERRREKGRRREEKRRGEKDFFKRETEGRKERK